MKYFREEPLYILGSKVCLDQSKNQAHTCPNCEFFTSTRTCLIDTRKTLLFYRACFIDSYYYKNIK